MQINRISIPVSSNKTQSNKQTAQSFGSFKVQILNEAVSTEQKHGPFYKEVFKALIQNLREKGYHFEPDYDMDYDLYTVRGKSSAHEFDLANSLSDNQWKVCARDIDYDQEGIAAPFDKNILRAAKEELKKLGLN